MKRALFITGVNCFNGGYAIAERFAREGYDIFLTSRNYESASEAAKNISEKYNVFSKGYQLAFRDEKAVKDIFSDIDSTGRFAETVCFYAANLGFFGANPTDGVDIFDTSVENFQEVLDTNVIWNFMMVKQAAERMRKEHKGAFVFISSNSAVRPNPKRVAYVASKGAMNSMSKALAVDLGKYGIRSNVVMPGTIKTERWVKMGDRQVSNGMMTPIGDISDHEDIANAVWYLGSDESKNVTGAEITVDGGMTCQIWPEILGKYRAEEINKNSKD